jgi:hypothetical protein
MNEHLIEIVSIGRMTPSRTNPWRHFYDVHVNIGHDVSEAALRYVMIQLFPGDQIAGVAWLRTRSAHLEYTVRMGHTETRIVR